MRVSLLDRRGREIVRKEVAELTTIGAPAPAAHRQVLDAVARLEQADIARKGQQVQRADAGGKGGPAKGKDLDEFIRRTLRQMIVDEGIERERDLTPWD